MFPHDCFYKPLRTDPCLQFPIVALDRPFLCEAMVILTFFLFFSGASGGQHRHLPPKIGTSSPPSAARLNALISFPPLQWYMFALFILHVHFFFPLSTFPEREIFSKEDLFLPLLTDPSLLPSFFVRNSSLYRVKKYGSARSALSSLCWR